MRWAVAAAAVGVGVPSVYGNLVEAWAYEVTETVIRIKDLPERFEGFRVAQVSDVHHSRLVSLDEVRRVVALANEARADMVALTGDYTTDLPKYVEPCAEALGELKAPEGVWAVLGNHDHRTDGALTREALRRRGIEVLTNENTGLRRGADVLQLAGVDDWGWGRADFPRAMRGVDTSRPSLLLSHEPMALDVPETRGVSLILSGHTHGGQICLPLVGAPAAYVWKHLKYLRGRYESAGTQLYVSRGTGVIGVPVRIGARPEVAVIRLERA
ncbi:MAG TPA: metallophosphoesterase [Pyrinomonadaceae bacterium]|nr:metallophosphoesterase [Pyrinomonadaceae bacterium]